MSQRRITNCSECAYARKTSRGLWCPFHDEAVSDQLVCDDFLDEYTSPLYASLAGEQTPAQLKPQFAIKDIIAYIVIIGCILIAAVCTCGMLTQ